MLAYSSTSLDHLQLHEALDGALKKGFVTPEEVKQIKESRPVSLYIPHFFVRIGLFLLTVLIGLVAYGLLCLFTGVDSNAAFSIMSFFSAIGVYIGLEQVVRHKKHFQSGIDDALIWLSLGFFLTATFVLFPSVAPLTRSFIVLGLAVFFVVRFANLLMTLLAFLSLLAVLYYSLLPIGALSILLLPFVMIIVSLSVYGGARLLSSQESFRHYSSCITLLKILSLTVAYLAGNYFVIREAGKKLLYLPLNDEAPLQTSWFFWGWTALVPLVYILRGIQKKNRVLLRTGLALMAVMVLTVHYYYAFWSAETLMCLSGIFLIITAYAAIRYLRTPRHGFTDKEPDDEGGLQVESLIVAETFSPAAPDAGKGFQFGGGSSGGGGATGQF